MLSITKCAYGMGNEQIANEISELVKRKNPADVEIYSWLWNDPILHTDNLSSDSFEYNQDGDYLPANVAWYDWFLLGEREYSDTVLANTSERADFEAWYGDKDAKVLVIVLKLN